MSGQTATVPAHCGGSVVGWSAVRWLMGCIACLALVGCGGDDVSGDAPTPKAVSTVTLQVGVPRTETLVAGVVEPYRVSEMSFDVSGVVGEVIDLGEAVAGPQLDGVGGLLLDGEGVPVEEGTVLARLEDTRYRQAVAAAELAIVSTERQITALEVELAEVLPAQIENAAAAAASAGAEVVSAGEAVTAAQADLELATTTVKRDRSLIASGAIAQSVLDQSESSFDTATAGLAQARATLESARQSERSAVAALGEARGSLEVRRADLESLKATRAERVNDLDRAVTDLESCVLRAPFSGRVTGRMVERGGFVNAGTAVVELTMQSVVKVVVTASAEQERRSELGSQLPVYVETAGMSEEPAPLRATVFEKAGVADQGTRTFRLGLILPNPLTGARPGGSEVRVASARDLFPVLRLPEADPDALFVNVAGVRTVGERTEVLVLPARGDEGSGGGGLASLVSPRWVAVTLLDEWAQLDTATLRRIAAGSGLQDGDVMVMGEGIAEAGSVVVGASDYLLRPGDVVRVGLDAALPTDGLWVPAVSIIRRTGDALVFVVVDGAAREVLVELEETSGAFTRVTSPGLSEAMEVVVSGMHYLVDGDAVTQRMGQASVGGEAR
ncbi:MAG: HlyD family efflux transporter periplasmic adaptor subunit [Planctomycetota bacterium]